ncbi:MAG: triose-phosphate isomerase [Deltaproteobacteria bacterium]|nr:triose-phosphate isomerase [Deltaproteobacteria bacterium]
MNPTLRKPLIAGNWKMYKTVREAVETARELVQFTAAVNVDVMIAPPFTALAPVADVVKGTSIALGAQNLFWKNEGAYTGEISPVMLSDIGCQYAIIGHSERRQYFGDTDESVNAKIRAALEHQLIPVFCVGETETQREAKETFSVLDKQVTKGLEGFSSESLSRLLVIAYEPVWAIGTGKTATTDQVQEVHAFLRSLVEKRFDNLLAKSVRILYGGSVKPDNVTEIMNMPDVDGALVGGASLSAKVFNSIIHFHH